VAHREKRTPGGVAIIRPGVHIPKVVSNRSAVIVPRQPITKQGEVIGKSGINKSHPCAAGICAIRPWGLKSLCPAKGFHVALELIHQDPRLIFEADLAGGSHHAAAICNRKKAGKKRIVLVPIVGGSDLAGRSSCEADFNGQFITTGQNQADVLPCRRAGGWETRFVEQPALRNCVLN
jgi:hypothetical protein